MARKGKKGKKDKPRCPPPPPPSSLPPPPPPSSHPPPPPSSPPLPSPLHPVLNVLPAASRLSVSSSLSRQEMEVLAYMITMAMVMESFNPMPSSKKAKEAFERFPGLHAHHKSPTFGCQCFPCYKIYWERWSSTSPSNRRHIHVALEDFEKSLSNWRNGNASSVENSENSRREDKRSYGLSLPALEDVVEEISDKEEQETRRSFAGKVLAILLYLFNPRAWGLWSPKKSKKPTGASPEKYKH